MVDDGRRRVSGMLRYQAGAPDPLYRHLLLALADDVDEGGPAWRPLAPVSHLGPDDAVPLRLLGAAHRLALAGDAPAYAAHLPTCGGDGDGEAAWPALRSLCESGALDQGVMRPVQTNEPGRAAALLCGFSAVTERFGLPLRLLEVGASAGLLLRFDTYRYEIGGQRWGQNSSTVTITADGDPPPLQPVAVASRRGCDPRPLDAEDDALLLLGFVWPTHLERFTRLRAALDAAVATPVDIDEASAERWLATNLADPAEGVATVVYHSIVWQYMAEEARRDAEATLADAGRRATRGAPLAWLRLEPHAVPERGAELRVTTWPEGDEEGLALCGYHGGPIRWYDRAAG